MVSPLALEKRTIHCLDKESKKMKHKSVLDPCWKVDGKFTSYKPLPSLVKTDSTSARYEECQVRLKCMKTDLTWLLCLPYEQFWCQAIHDERLHRCLDTYLRYSPRFYDNNDNLQSDETVQALHSDVHRLVFLTCLRMATYHESKVNFITASVFADIIYENFLFHVPMMIDLCLLYGRSNQPLLTKMISNIFNNQQNYNRDLDSVLQSICQVFDTVAAQCDVTHDLVELPPKLDWLRTGSFNSQSDKEVSDLIDYILDISHSLTAFLNIYPAASQSCMDHQLFTKIAWFYSNVIPVLKQAVSERDFNTVDLGDDMHLRIRKRLSQSRGMLVKLVRKILYNSTLLHILEAESDVSDHVENYLQALMAMLNDRKFMNDYEVKFPFCEDMEMIGQTEYKVDETRVNYIKEALSINDSKSTQKPKKTSLKYTVSKEEAKKMKSKVMKVRPGAAIKSAAVVNGGCDSVAMNGAAGADLESFGACAPSVSGVELESLISAVHDIVPDLGHGFIERCLDEYNYDQSAVIDAVLNDSLRPNVANLDRNLPRQKPKQDLVSTRRNVYDGDEFDIFNNPNSVDLTRVTRGKKHEGLESTSMVLDDHTEVETYRAALEKYSTIDQLGDPIDYDKMYDDEYDDTYDTADVGAMLDADEIEETFKVQPLNEKKGPRNYHPQQDEEELDEENPRPRDHFVTDPARLREQREQRRAAQAPQGRKQHDVVGRAKGQGQDNSVLKNRNYKDKNKARLGNHNRRAQADRKMAKGMF